MEIRLIDTCLPCYLTDHCNGPYELLIGVPVYKETCNADMRNDLFCAIRDSEFDLDDKPGFDDAAAKEAVRVYFAAKMDANPLAPWPGARYVEVGAEDESDFEQPCSWFRLSWEAPAA